MSNKLKRTLAALMLACTVISAAACSSGGTDTSDTTAADTAANAVDADTTAGETEPERLYPDVPDTNWDGRTFNVLGRTHDDPTRWFFVNFEIFAEAENGEVVNDAVYRRNRDIEEKYNAVIKQDLFVNPETDLVKLVQAGESSHDAAFQNQLRVTTSAQSGALMDMYSLDYLDFSKPWWNSELNDRLSICNKLYFTTGDFALVDKQRTSILFFNRDMADEYSLGNKFDAVREGKWTLDMLIEDSVKVSRDLNGDGIRNQHDQFGFGGEYYNSSVMAFACDNIICGKDADDTPILKMEAGHWSESLDKIVKLTSNKDIMFFEQDYNGKYDGDYYQMTEDLFKDGRLLYCSTFVESFKDMSADCTDEYGVIPFPKYDEAQEKYYTLSAQGLVITVPKTAKDPDFSGFMLEVLSAYSSYTTLPAYIEVSCKTKYTYDADSAEMLDLTFDGLIFDLGQLYNWGDVFNIPYNIGKEGQNNFASRYASLESAAVAAMEKTVDTYLGLK